MDKSLSPFKTQSWPTEIRYKKKLNTLEIDFDDGVSYSYSAELLRGESPSAEIRGHDGEKKIIGGCINVSIKDIQSVGNYAIRLVFNDGHDTGIFSWSYLRYLGDNRDKIWAKYLNELEKNGQSRDL